ncbi:YeeE/YedE family protein [Pseudovibrio exalbescens]|uniref:YeeE/YedE family protein n=1 Tax=Pseudovibrio exalbescens TaxID=197461 RepID=UPI0023652688|nr:YeeE/YedE family protein [Pseudovibrio exalbescens]MDD7909907.1 YeeE/YedE family protein [Pseudovibrio exalbescens]
MALAQTGKSSQKKPQAQWAVVGAGLIGILLVGLASAMHGGSRLFWVTLIGGIAGVSLYHASFGFTGAWRRAIEERRGAGLRAQFLLLFSVCVVSYPLLEYGNYIGLGTSGFVFPFGVAAAFGAFMFGVGMQIAGGCASGTLFTVGGGSTRMIITLTFFIVGSVLATAHLPAWSDLPALPAISLVEVLGAAWALILTTLLLAALTLVSVLRERRHHGFLEDDPRDLSLLRGPWSKSFGAGMLAFVCIATFIIVGRPWGVTSGFALWGAKLFYALGVPIDTWSYWQHQMGAVNSSIFQDTTSVMNFSIMLGALVASGLAGLFAPVYRLSAKEVTSAIIGGLLLGYGARLAFGCNIGAFLGGVTSGSIHGWLWLVFAFSGAWVVSRSRLLSYLR